MTTTAGVDALGRAVAQFFATHINVGVGSTAPTVNDQRLQFEVARVPIRTRSYDASTNTITYTATIPDHLYLNIAEIGLITASEQTATSGIITTFDSGTETWSAGTWTPTNSRIGNEGLSVALQTATLVGNSRVALTDVKQSDTLQVAYFGNGGTVEVRLGNSTVDYRSFTFTPQAGYNVATAAISSMATTGTPDITSANHITVIHSGSGSVLLDAIRVSSVSDSEVLIDRQVLSPIRLKAAGMPLDIEFPMGVAG